MKSKLLRPLPHLNSPLTPVQKAALEARYYRNEQSVTPKELGLTEKSTEVLLTFAAISDPANAYVFSLAAVQAAFAHIKTRDADGKET